MNPATASLLALLIVLLLSLVNRVNIGVPAIGLAWLVGAGLAGLGPAALMETFPVALFLTLLGVSLLFESAEHNGSLAILAHALLGLCRGIPALVPVMFFLVAGLLSSLGPGVIASTALLAPLAMSLSVTARIPPLLMIVMLANGANAGNLSPISMVGALVGSLLDKAGLPDLGPALWAASLTAHALVSVAAYLLLGGIGLIRRGRMTEALPVVKFERTHAFTLGVLLAWLLGVTVFGLPLGYSAFVFVAVLLLAGAIKDRVVLGAVPWGTIIMICGVSMLVGVAAKAGGIARIEAGLAGIATPGSANAVMALMAGVLSVFTSSSGVVYPTLLPAVPGFVAQLGGGSPAEVALSIGVAAALVDVSPFSTVGALCLAARPREQDSAVLFRRMLLWSFAMVPAGALFCHRAARWFV